MKITGGDDRPGRKIDKLRKEMEKYQAKQAAVDGGFWKGRKIVSFDDWHKILHKRRSEVFDHIPNDYVPGILMYFPNDDSEIVHHWHFDYLTFLANKKNHKLGEELCGKCILSGAKGNYDSMGIKEIVFRDLQKAL